MIGVCATCWPGTPALHCDQGCEFPHLCCHVQAAWMAGVGAERCHPRPPRHVPYRPARPPWPAAVIGSLPVAVVPLQHPTSPHQIYARPSLARMVEGRDGALGITNALLPLN